MDADLILKIITIIISILTLCGFGVVMKFFWEDRHRKKLEATEEAKRRQKEARQKEVQEVLHPLEDKVNAISADLKDTKGGIQSEIRHDIRNTCRRCIKQGFKTLEDIEEVTAMHVNYEKLGTNGKTNALYEEFKKLSVRPEEDHLEFVRPKPRKVTKKGGSNSGK